MYRTLLIILLSLPGAANAAMMMSLFDGTNTLTISDNGAGDLDANDGMIVYHGSFGGFDFNMDLGSSWPAIEAPQLLHLNVVVNNSDTSDDPAFVRIGLTNTDFNAGDAFAFGLGGSGPATVTGEAYVDDGNVEFGTSTLIGAIGPVSGIGFSGQAFAYDVGNSNPYSATLYLNLSQIGTGMTSVDSGVNIPEPLTIALLASSLLGLRIGARRQR